MANLWEEEMEDGSWSRVRVVALDDLLLVVREVE